jgi:glycerol uptake facilitator-like aquaporin
MEKPHGDKFILPVLITEFFGTMLLMLAVNLAGNDEFVASLAFFAMIVCTYEVSGGHLNPAISAGVYIAEKAYVRNLLFLIFITMV